MDYERTRKKNPLGITINQHFHSAHSISKFCNRDKKVEVFNKETSSILTRKKDAMIFCAKRNWDERAEHGYMADIEKAFHNQIDNIRTKRDHQAISKYYLLWQLRYQVHINRLPNLKLDGIPPDYLTKEQQEILEKRNVGFVNSDGEMPARQATGILIQRNISELMKRFTNTEWGLLHAKEGHFLCADSYQNLCFIPVGPKFAFAAGLSDKLVDIEELALINKESVLSAKEFYFAKDLKKCPIA
ncbi:hypothetical protein LH716_004226 [Vibrio vulnificus]|uniref:hypothetical protein n=1 Tax=Vibrio cidicii TaxID=1763883 RepID=UPI0018C31D3E|nr:hypothetical protein [Vibrio cidicii]EGR0102463.1 hypothetical protein [Vibrio vulnificus]EIA1300252.1 hypothetical protein [Vibrio vulnificus]EIJ0971138.1 hypothetical protein [Vibrio vulnificus]EIZ4627321.1 hypothetical protein [Vibrio vulnificus]EJB0234392.1 hypothetical protein [Vibrio vulnificus]